ncbi:unnamed protein product, partial [Rotaria sordida]
MEKNKPASQLLLPITDDYSILKGLINAYFANVSGLKYKTTHSDIYYGVDIDAKHEKFIIGEENFLDNLEFFMLNSSV